MLKYIYLLTLACTLYACEPNSASTTATEAPTETETPDALDESAAENRDCIARIIALDEQLSATRNQATENQPLSKTIKEYRAAMTDFDYTGCPPELEPAVQRHLDVWQNILEVTDKHPTRRGEMSALFKELQNGPDGARVKAFLQRSYDTWMEVSSIVSANK